MKTTKIMQRAALAALAGMALAAASAQAQGVNDYIVDQFGTDTSANWTSPWGLEPIVITWDSTENTTLSTNPQGAIKIVIPFSSNIANNDALWQVDLGAVVDLSKYTNIHFDLMVDPSSGQRLAGGIGAISMQARDYNWDYYIGDNFISQDPVIGSDYGTWNHYVVPINQQSGNLSDMSIIYWEMWQAGGGDITNPVTLWMDNVWFETNNVPPPPPSVALAPAAKGLNLIAVNNYDANAWRYNNIRTTTGNQTWVGQPGSVTYQMSIAQAANVSGFQSQIYLIPGAPVSTGSSSLSHSSLDYITASRALVWIYDNGDGTANAEFDYAANDQNYDGNATQLATITSAKMAGTWKLTFNNNTNVTLTAADGTSTNFVMPPAAVAYFASGVDVFYGESANGVSAAYGKGILINNVQVTGTAAPINDSFTGPGLSATWAVQAWDPSGVVVTTSSSKYWLNWTFPATGFTPEINSSLTANTWAGLDTSSLIIANPTMNRLLVDASALPAGNTGFMRLIQRTYTQLLVLMPGETNAPNTEFGKGGTPIEQPLYTQFNVTVCACDATWHIVPGTSDMIAITSTDPYLYVQPSASAPMGLNGTAVFSCGFGTAGSQTITATDATDGTKTPNTGSPTTAY